MNQEESKSVHFLPSGHVYLGCIQIWHNELKNWQLSKGERRGVIYVDKSECWQHFNGIEIHGINRGRDEYTQGVTEFNESHLHYEWKQTFTLEMKTFSDLSLGKFPIFQFYVCTWQLVYYMD